MCADVTARSSMVMIEPHEEFAVAPAQWERLGTAID